MNNISLFKEDAQTVHARPLVARRLQAGRARQEDPAQDDAGESQWEVDRERRAPSPRPDEQAAERRADHGDRLRRHREQGEDDRRRRNAGALSFGADQVHSGGIAGARAEAEHDPCHDQPPDAVVRHRDDQSDRSRDRHQHAAREEEALHPVDVDQTADERLTDRRGEVEGRHEPHRLRGRRAQCDADRGESDRDDGGVDRIQGRAQHHRREQPPIEAIGWGRLAGHQSRIRSRMAVAAASVISSACDTSCESVSSSQASPASLCPATWAQPASVRSTICRRPSVGSWLRVTKPSPSSASTIAAMDCGRTCSAIASALTVETPPLLSRDRAEACDGVIASVVASRSLRSSRARTARRLAAICCEVTSGCPVVI